MALLVVDDDEELCSLVGKVFNQAGIEARFVHRGDQGLTAAAREAFELVVLDVMLPGIDGFEVLRRLRRTSDVPVIMLSARGEDVDRIVGLEIGADDYLAKPFHPRELVARVRAILRRSTQTAAGDERLTISGIRLDPAARSVHVDGHAVELTTAEFDVLSLLMRSAGRVLSRDTIVGALDGRDCGPFDRSVDMHVSNLRKKLGERARSIVTVRGVGYQFARRDEGAA